MKQIKKKIEFNIQLFAQKEWIDDKNILTGSFDSALSSDNAWDDVAITFPLDIRTNPNNYYTKLKLELFDGRDTSKIYQSVELDLDTETLDGRTLRDAIKSIDGIFIYTWWYKDIKDDSSAFTDYYINCILASTNDRGDPFLDIPLEVQNTIGYQDAVYLRTTFYYTTKDKLITLDRMNDFLSGMKNRFLHESATKEEIEGLF